MTNEASRKKAEGKKDERLLQLHAECSLHVFKRQLGRMHSYFLYILGNWQWFTHLNDPKNKGIWERIPPLLKFFYGVTLCDVFLVWVDIYNSSVQETKQGGLATGNATGTTWCFRFRHSQASTRLKLKFTCKRFSNAGTLGRFIEAWWTVKKQTTWSVWATIILIILW